MRKIAETGRSLKQETTEEKAVYEPRHDKAKSFLID